MTLIDIVIAIAVIIGFILGFKDGIIRKIFGLVGFVLAIYLSIKFAGVAGKIIVNVFGIEYYLAEIIGGIVIYIVISLVTTLIKRVVHPHDKVNNSINQLIGGVVGVVQILFFTSAFLFILNIFSYPKDDVKNKSILYNKVYDIIPQTVKVINFDLFKKVKEGIDKKNKEK
ncbi:MAG: CvpA family protein [Bacteroidota bacterium]|nr:CvpA family protein [Bacteroidota bacterium]